MARDQSLMYRSHHSIKIGGTHRFIISYFPQQGQDQQLDFINSPLYIKIKNVELLPLRAAFLAGPYVLYCDVKPQDYNSNKPCFITADQPQYDPNLNPSQSLVAELSLHTLKDKYVWVVDVQSQIIFSTSADINYEIMIGSNKSKLHTRSFGDSFGNFSKQHLIIQHLDTVDLWNKPPPFSNDKIHLVILTHGLHSNTTADMFYLKEKIEEMAEKTSDNVVVRGYTGNVCKTERGVKYQGRRLAEWLVHDVVPSLNIEKISFIAHSLGGLTQTFAISYIDHNYPEFFHNVQLENLINLASPLLGISNENPAYVKMALSFGIVGKTGMDLNLQGSKPLLMLLPSERTRKVLKKFKRRTLYANTLNDGIVPLRTSALVFLDWKGLGKVYETLKKENSLNPNADNLESPSKPGSEEVGVIPSNVENREVGNKMIKRSSSGSFDLSTSFRSKLLSPIQNVVGYYVPLLQGAPIVKKTKKYRNYQTQDNEIDFDLDDDHDKFPDRTVNRSLTDDSEISSIDPSQSIQSDKSVKIPKSNVIESLTNVLVQPTPPKKFITDPESRDNVILHDKIYKPSSIPERKLERTSSTFLNSLDPIKRQKILEEKIARKWHKGMTWRKVLVNLSPDAHNNILVRRRFANGYGWQVIDHLVENHFGYDAVKGLDYKNYEWNDEYPEYPADSREAIENDEAQLNYKFEEALTMVTPSKPKRKGSNCTLYSDNGSDFEGEDADIIYTSYLNDNGDKDDATISDEDDNDLEWLNDVSSFNYDGPTGMLNTVTETANHTYEAFKRAVFHYPTETDQIRNSTVTTTVNGESELYHAGARSSSGSNPLVNAVISMPDATTSNNDDIDVTTAIEGSMLY